MDLKGQPQSSGIAAANAPENSEPPHALLTGNTSCESVAASREGGRKPDVAWLFDTPSGAELQAHMEFARVLSRRSKIFINLPADHIDDEIYNGLKELAEVLDLDRVSINLFDSDK